MQTLMERRKRQAQGCQVIACFVLCCLMCLTAVASSAAPVIQQGQLIGASPTPKPAQISVTSTPVQGDIYNALAGKAQVNLNNAQAGGIYNALSQVSSVVCTALLYFIVFGMTVNTLLDFVAITIPATRGLIAPNVMANGGQFSRFGMGRPMPTMGGYGGGMGGYGGGMGGMGGYGGAMGGMQGGGMPMGGMQRPQGGLAARGITLISTDASNAILMAQQPGPDGKCPSAIRIYAKSMMLNLIILGVALLLVATGALFDLGLAVGKLLGGLLAKLGGVLVTTKI